MEHKLILEGVLKARCSCGGWKYIGLTPEASKSVEKVYKYHSDFAGIPVPDKPKKKKRKKK